MSVVINEKYGATLAVPTHHLEEYPKFVEFMGKYFEHLYRDPSNFPKEVADELTVDERDERGAARFLSDYRANLNLERRFVALEDEEGNQILDADDRPIMVEVDQTDFINAWFDEISFPRPLTPLSDEPVSDVDVIRILKLLKDIFRIRGSEHATKLFFKIFFDVIPVITYPREKISRLDDNFVLDGDNVPRDDDRYQEYSYVIGLPVAYSVEQETFLQIFKDYFHPAGFKVFVENN
ncbi:baseplate subunit [Vibrio phage YC]|uniref:Baseplate subunit n=1 Tax=Vibrio phage YC TaxID=2267403 RepID=A0A384ZSB3_9CAUD|nr:head closure Hc2 [Vibrio phage YC]AXC34533.1 baseplate subunit [Vibrio phage YC]